MFGWGPGLGKLFLSGLPHGEKASAVSGAQNARAFGVGRPRFLTLSPRSLHTSIDSRG